MLAAGLSRGMRIISLTSGDDEAGEACELFDKRRRVPEGGIIMKGFGVVKAF
jgi:hypothetical protein